MPACYLKSMCTVGGSYCHLNPEYFLDAQVLEVYELVKSTKMFTSEEIQPRRDLDLDSETHVQDHLLPLLSNIETNKK